MRDVREGGPCDLEQALKPIFDLTSSSNEGNKKDSALGGLLQL